jgi:C_GCAxxG_C_C family probable redox protein
MTHLEKAKALRADTQTHYNCAQSVLLAFGDRIGLTEEQAFQVASHFGAGMRHGATCGVLSGGLMVLGLLGYDEKAAGELLRQFREKHEATQCAELLSRSKDRGIARKEHCDGLVLEMVETLEQILSAQGE